MAELPTGTVTFLFTDLEVSTRLWEQEPEAMRSALARHDAILRDAVAAQGGAVVKGRGDGFHAVFGTADNAVAAALDAQVGVAAEDWRVSEPLRVRMGLHTGVAELRDGDYFGRSVNRAARLMDAANGGQVVLSEATAALVRDSLPPGTTLLDLGEHRLKDLSRAERVYELHRLGVGESFPALRSLEGLQNNLPVQLTSFIGRESEIAAVAGLFEGNRLVTLTGAAGCGKTRLAFEVGAEMLGRFADGVWLVELAALIDPGLVAGAIASALGIRQPDAGVGASFDSAGGSVVVTSLEEVVLEYLGSKEMVLILDNCEHLVAACASFADRSLHACPGLRILATSRGPLGVDGEVTRRVPSLSVPDADHLARGDQVGDYEAVQLFVDRAALRAVGFAPTGEDMAAIAQICRRLDGIPLAIELAAARVKVLAPADIAERLDDQFSLLTGGSRTGLERHQTLRAAVDWSYNQLTEPEQRLLARLAVFAGSFSLEAAEAIGSDDTVPAGQVLDLLEHLVDRSLVDTEPNQTGVRYRLLESIRQYGRERLATSGEADALRRRHRDFFAQFTKRARRGLWGPESGRWAQLVAADLDNIRAAMEWDLARHDGTAALEIAASLDVFWVLPARFASFREGLSWLERCLAAAGEQAPVRLRARALGTILVYAGQVGEPQRALAAGEAALALHRELDDPRGLGLVLGQLAPAARDLGRGADAQAYLDEAIQVSRDSGFPPALGGALWIKSLFAFNSGDLDGARSAAEEVLAHRDRYAPQLIEQNLVMLGAVAFAEGQYATAITFLEEAAQIQERTRGTSAWGAPARGLAVTSVALGDLERARRTYQLGLAYERDHDSSPGPEARCLTGLGQVSLYEGDLEQADTYQRRAFELLDRSELPVHFSEYLAAFARIALARGDADRAARLLGASDAIRGEVKFISFEWPHPSETITATRNALDDSTFATAWAEGRAMSPRQALTYALHTPSQPSHKG